MFRRVLILAFTLSVVGNSLAAAAQVGNDACGACCGPPNNQLSVRLSPGCCYSECGEPGQTPPASPKDIQGIERSYKADATDAVVVAPVERQTLAVLQSSARRVIQSTHIYLRTGTLLI